MVVATAAGSLILPHGSATAGEETTQILVATAVTRGDVHWKVVATRRESGLVRIKIHERTPSGHGTYGGASPEASCGEIGIASTGVSRGSGELPGLTTASGQITPKVASVSVRLNHGGGTSRYRAETELISARDAAALGTKRFGWWFGSFRRAAFNGRLTAVAESEEGTVIPPAAIHDEDGFRCSE